MKSLEPMLLCLAQLSLGRTEYYCASSQPKEELVESAEYAGWKGFRLAALRERGADKG